LLVTSATAATLASCDSMRPREGFLGRMERVNQRFQSWLLSPDSRAPAYTAADETPLANMPPYFVSMSMPIAPPNWVLLVGGMVARPRRFSLDELMRMTRTDLRVEHHCVEGWSAIQSWHGVRLRDLADVVGADPRARFVDFQSFDSGYHSSWDRESALHAQTLLAYGVHGQPLTPEHGAPLRLYSPVKLGYKNVKYLTEVKFLPRENGGYWEDRGYEWFAGT
jgi:DMSO/TMAO reductase YedYZ molybdopterin-dependent catalytic subunit